MKKLPLIALLCIAVAVGVITTASGDVDTFANFEQAASAGEEVRVAGLLAKDMPIEYNPEKNPNYFSFYLTDEQGHKEKVVLLEAKPQDFEMSEQVVVTGSMRDGTFVATDLLMKCPSKYKDEEIALRRTS